MHKKRSAPLYLLFAASVLFFTAACRPPLPTTQEDLADYIIYGSQGGKIRKLDETAQAYADKVLRLYFQLKNAQQPMLALADPKQLWPLQNKDNSKGTPNNKAHQKPTAWETKQPKKRLQLIHKWLEDASSIESGLALRVGLQKLLASASSLPSLREQAQKLLHQTTQRARLRAQLQTLLTSPPSLPSLAKSPKVSLSQRLQQALLQKLDQREHTARLIANTHLNILQKAVAKADYIKSPLAQADWTQTYNSLIQFQQTELAALRRALISQKTTRDSALQRKKQLRSAGLSDESSWRSYLRLELEVHYYDALIQKAEARLQTSTTPAPQTKTTPKTTSAPTRPQPASQPTPAPTQPASRPTPR